MQDLVSTLILLGIVQGAVLAAVLASRRANRLANRLLAALVACLALMMALGEIGRRWGFSGHPHLLGLGAPLPFLFGPLLYLNTYRVEALEAALRDPAKAARGVLELAFEVGFSSKSTVNSFFKKVTGTDLDARG